MPTPESAAPVPDNAVLAPSSTAWATLIDDQVVLLDRSTQACHVLDASAALVWSLIDGHRSVGQVLDRLQHETGVERSVLAIGVDAALRSFAAAGLVRPTDDGTIAAPEGLVERAHLRSRRSRLGRRVGRRTTIAGGAMSSLVVIAAVPPRR